MELIVCVIWQSKWPSTIYTSFPLILCTSPHSSSLVPRVLSTKRETSLVNCLFHFGCNIWITMISHPPFKRQISLVYTQQLGLPDQHTFTSRLLAWNVECNLWWHQVLNYCASILAHLNVNGIGSWLDPNFWQVVWGWDYHSRFQDFGPF